jgi:3-hydroxyacyl-[acyl-carrier-protein] dehydratase
MGDETCLEFDINGIKACQNNRYPLLFIDKVFDVVPGERASGLKCFSYNEWFFPPHFEDDPNVPGFIQLEAMVQTFIMTFLTLCEHKGKKTNFLKINNTSFRRKIVPGETLVMNAKLKSFRRGIASGDVEGYVSGELTCSSEFVVGLPDLLNKFSPSKG